MTWNILRPLAITNIRIDEILAPCAFRQNRFSQLFMGGSMQNLQKSKRNGE